MKFPYVLNVRIPKYNDFFSCYTSMFLKYILHIKELYGPPSNEYNVEAYMYFNVN